MLQEKNAALQICASSTKNALREAIHYDPHTVSPEKMEKFTELFVRSLEGKGDKHRNAV